MKSKTLASWKKSYDKTTRCIKKQKHHFAHKFHIVKTMVFSVVLNRYEGWTIKKAECWKWMLLTCGAGEETLESPLDYKEIKPVNPKDNPEYSLEWLLLKLKLQYLATRCEKPTHWKGPWCWERLRARGEGDDRGWDGWMASSTQWTWIWANSGRLWRTEEPGCNPWGLQRMKHDLVTEQQ